MIQFDRLRPYLKNPSESLAELVDIGQYRKGKNVTADQEARFKAIMVESDITSILREYADRVEAAPREQGIRIVPGDIVDVIRLSVREFREQRPREVIVSTGGQRYTGQPEGVRKKLR